ncbi:hypothetical protein T484DRAFT_3638807 [Baffinella frigidus]|nr:hypothetical protein T484DRAFT_3638807 [Cryptophyta sp. CCMP2293]
MTTWGTAPSTPNIDTKIGATEQSPSHPTPPSDHCKRGACVADDKTRTSMMSGAASAPNTPQPQNLHPRYIPQAQIQPQQHRTTTKLQDVQTPRRPSPTKQPGRADAALVDTARRTQQRPGDTAAAPARRAKTSRKTSLTGLKPKPGHPPPQGDQDFTASSPSAPLRIPGGKKKNFLTRNQWLKPDEDTL